MADETDITASMAEGSIDINGYKITGVRLYSLALLVVGAYVIASLISAYRDGDISGLKEISLIIIGCFFGKKL